MAELFYLEIRVNPKGVQAVRIVGDTWEQPRAYELLGRLGPVIQELDALAKGECPPIAIPPEERLQ